MLRACIVASIINHGHDNMLMGLVDKLLLCPEIARVIVTHNLPEKTNRITDPRIYWRSNPKPLGYGANQNAAYGLLEAPYFCILNPDIKIKENPFPKLLEKFSLPKVALVGPQIVSPDGQVEDSVRRFPTLRSLSLKALGKDDGTYKDEVPYPDWIAGMFMLFRSDVFHQIGGFDERYFLYYEDVDICWRLKKNGYQIKINPNVQVIHDARRKSRKNWRYACWHLSSMLRFLIKSKSF